MFSIALLFPGLTIFKPILCVVPSGLVLFQWLEGLEKFPNLVIIVGYGEQPPASSSKRQWVSATAMKEAPNNLRHWTRHLRYVSIRAIQRLRVLKPN